MLKTLAKRPADRYATATDLADDLKRFLNHEPVRARRISPLGRFWRFARRHPSQTIVSATAAATVLAVLTVAYVQIMQERDQANQASAAARDPAQEDRSGQPRLQGHVARAALVAGGGGPPLEPAEPAGAGSRPAQAGGRARP